MVLKIEVERHGKDEISYTFVNYMATKWMITPTLLNYNKEKLRKNFKNNSNCK
jgi:hypothetical protein